MFCTSCGNRIDDNDIFCPACGAKQPRRAAKAAESPAQNRQDYKPEPVPVRPVEPVRQPEPVRVEPVRQPEPVKPAKKPEKRRGGIPGWLMLIIGFVAAAAIAAGLIFSGLLGSAGKGAIGKIEGSGYNTPEDAVMAYAEALKAGDYDRMLSTFAVESFCENYDTQKLMERGQYYHITLYNMFPVAPAEDDLIIRINTEKRRNYILDFINYQVLSLANANTNGSLDKLVNNDTYSFDSGQTGKRDMSYLIQDLQDLPDLSKMEIEDIVYAETLADIYLDTNNIQNLIRQAEIDGADGYKSLAVTFTLDGLEGAIIMDVARYNGKWYNVLPSGNLGAIMGLPYYSGGLAVTSDRALFREYREMIEDQDEKLKSWRSNLGKLEKKWENQNTLSMSFDEMADFISLTELKD